MVRDGEPEQRSDILEDKEADFTKLDLNQMANLRSIGERLPQVFRIRLWTLNPATPIPPSMGRSKKFWDLTD